MQHRKWTVAIATILLMIVAYFLFTVGINEETIRKYVQMQGKEDSGQAKLVF